MKIDVRHDFERKTKRTSTGGHTSLVSDLTSDADVTFTDTNTNQVLRVRPLAWQATTVEAGAPAPLKHDLRCTRWPDSQAHTYERLGMANYIVDGVALSAGSEAQPMEAPALETAVE